MSKSPDYHILEKDPTGRVWIAGSYYSPEERDKALTQKTRLYPGHVYRPFHKEGGLEAARDWLRKYNNQNGHTPLSPSPYMGTVTRDASTYLPHLLIDPPEDPTPTFLGFDEFNIKTIWDAIRDPRVSNVALVNVQFADMTVPAIACISEEGEIKPLFVTALPNMGIVLLKGPQAKV